ncbi:MAG TPA: alpha/beta hydrolase [Rhodothermales bacterium]|nr:alpha/beta hydrolase [Rhodothermales bacterium]
MTTPTLVIRGARDPIVPTPWAKAVADLVPHAAYAEVSGAAHAAHYSAPDAVAELVRTFLSQQAIPSPARLRA